MKFIKLFEGFLNEGARDIKFNGHIGDFRKSDFTVEFDVKNPNMKGLSDDVSKMEFETGDFANAYAQQLADEVKKKVKSSYWSVSDWSFAGRSNGWLVLLCDGDPEKMTASQKSQMQSIFDKYWADYNKNLLDFYKEENVKESVNEAESLDNIGILHSNAGYKRQVEWQKDNATTPIEVGDYVKIAFLDNRMVEWMWVNITHVVTKDSFEGRLDNDPVAVTNVNSGDTVKVDRSQIAQLIKKDEM
jgi:uncharacterized protein YegJ (DUF2314 family)